MHLFNNEMESLCCLQAFWSPDRGLKGEDTMLYGLRSLKLFLVSGTGNSTIGINSHTILYNRLSVINRFRRTRILLTDNVIGSNYSLQVGLGSKHNHQIEKKEFTEGVCTGLVLTTEPHTTCLLFVHSKKYKQVLQDVRKMFK